MSTHNYGTFQWLLTWIDYTINYCVSNNGTKQRRSHTAIANTSTTSVYVIHYSILYTYSKWRSPRPPDPLESTFGVRARKCAYMFSENSSLKLTCISTSGTLWRNAGYYAPINFSLFKGSGIVCGVILGLKGESNMNNHLLSFIV